MLPLPLAAAVEFPVHLLLPLTSSVVYVAAALSLKRASQEGAGIWRSTFVMNVAVAACFAVLLLLDPRAGPGPTPWWQPALIGLLFMGGQALTMIALSRGDVSIATPVMGTKVVFVAFFVTLVVGDRLTADYWVSAAMSAVGIGLLNVGGQSAGTHRHLALTVVASLAAAACYAMFDVLVRKWAGAWGVGRLLPAVMACAALMSLALWPAFEGPLRGMSRAAGRPLLLGSACIGVQALLLVYTLGTHPDTTRINVVYNSRGLWSVVAVWLVGHWWGNTERHAGRAVFAWRLAGAVLLLGAIVVAVVHPFDGTTP